MSIPQAPESTPWRQLRRFLNVGTEGTVLCLDGRPYSPDDAIHTATAIREDGPRALAEVDRAGCREAALYALALAASYGETSTRKAALSRLNRLARTTADLFAFCEACRGLRGWGRGLRTAVADWYNSLSPARLAYELTIPADGAWSHRDLLRLAHPVAPTPYHDELYRWTVDPDGAPRPSTLDAPQAPEAVAAKSALQISGSVLLAVEVGAAASEAEALITALRTAQTRLVGFSTEVHPVVDARELAQIESSGPADLTAPFKVSGSEADVIIAVTSAAVWSPLATPTELIESYRQRVGRTTKLVVLAPSASRPLFGEQSDTAVLHIVGTDDRVAQRVAAFCA